MILKTSFLRLTLIVVFVLIWAGLSIAPHFSEQGYELEKKHENTYQESKVLRMGNVNGIPIAVPSNYLHFAFEYHDKSIWEPKKPGDVSYEQRSYEDAVGSFAIYVRWPDMNPRNRDTEKSYSASRNNSGEHPWLLVAVFDSYLKTPRPPERPDNGLARVLRGQINRISKRHVQMEAAGVRYAFRGVDSNTGLQWAEPVGPSTEQFHTWNMTYYWMGDMNGVVTELIECYNGTIPKSIGFQKCEHRFVLPEWNAYISLSYPRSWLPRWRKLKESTRELMLGFQVVPNEKVLINPVIVNKESGQ